MEKISSTKSKKYWPIIIYSDELVEIENILLSNVNSDGPDYEKELRIEAGNWRYSSIDDLVKNYPKENRPRVEDLTIRLMSLRLNFSKYETKVSWDEDSTHDSGVFYKVDEILSKNVRTPKFIYEFQTFILVLLFSFIFSKIDIYLVPEEFLIYPFVLNIVLIGFFLYTSFVRDFRKSVVYVKPRETGGMLNWIESHKNQLIVGTTLLVFGWGINELGDRFFDAPMPIKQTAPTHPTPRP